MRAFGVELLSWMAAMICCACANGVEPAEQPGTFPAPGPADRATEHPSPGVSPDGGQSAPPALPDDGEPPSPSPAACAPADPGTLPPCCETYGGAHCLDESQVPAGLRASLEACSSGGLCVLDTSIASRFANTPRPCASIGGNPGACVSMCIPQVAANSSFLPQDVCAASERCAPCTNPLDGSNTGICDPTPGLECDSSGGAADAGPSAPAEPAPPPPPPPTPCCSGRATCIASSVVPADRRSHLAQDSCSADQLCIPNELIENPTPPPCTILWLTFLGGDSRGACLSDCLPEIGSQPLLGQEGCAAGFKCAPCVDPFSRAPTGLCP